MGRDRDKFVLAVPKIITLAACNCDMPWSWEWGNGRVATNKLFFNETILRDDFYHNQLDDQQGPNPVI